MWNYIKIRLIWLKNGWLPGFGSGRDIKLPCGHIWYVGYGISKKRVLNMLCIDCEIDAFEKE